MGVGVGVGVGVRMMDATGEMVTRPSVSVLQADVPDGWDGPDGAGHARCVRLVDTRFAADGRGEGWGRSGAPFGLDDGAAGRARFV